MKKKQTRKQKKKENTENMFKKSNINKPSNPTPSNEYNEIVKIGAVSNKFGNGSILVNEEWIKLNKGVDLAEFSKGETYEIQIKVGNDGRRYVNAVINDSPAVRAEVDEVPKVVRAVVPTPAPVKSKAEFRTADEIKRSSAIGIAGGSELYKHMLQDAEGIDDARRMLLDLSGFVLEYIESGAGV